MAKDSVLVTGSSGFIGTALVERLLDSGYRVTGIDRQPNPWSDPVDDRTERLDILADDLSELGDEYDVIVHLAAHSRVRSAVENPAEATENARTTRTLLDFARAADVDDVIYASSREVYGLSDEVRFEESDATPRGCANPYAASKLAGEALCWAYRNCYGLNTSVLRLTNVYGRYDRQARVVPLFISQALAGTRLSVFGEGKVLDFVYLDDCVDAFENAVERTRQIEGEAINVGSGVGTSLVELARHVSEMIDRCPGYDVDAEQTGEPTKAITDVAKARALLGYEPSHSFEDGLSDTIEWYRNHPTVTESLR